MRTAVERLVEDCRALIRGGAPAEVGLYGAVDRFIVLALDQVAKGAGWQLLQQTRADDMGVPDFRITRKGDLQGWIEAKAFVGKDLDALTGRDKSQVERFIDGLENLIVTTGWRWRLYQHGRLVNDVVLGPAVLFDPRNLSHPVSGGAIDELTLLFEQFASAASAPFGTAEEAVQTMALRAKALKSALLEVGENSAPDYLRQLKVDFAALLYRNGNPFTWQRFVDSYVQLATFGTLLWRLETGKEVSLDRVPQVEHRLHPLLSQCMQILWAPESRTKAIEPVLEETCRTANLIELPLFEHKVTPTGQETDPIIDAYEPFFSVYDSAARENAGVYYTPVDIVSHIIHGIDHLLRSGLNRSDGILDEDARFLDPATGTGTFLLGLTKAVAERAEALGLPRDALVRDVLEQRCAAFEIFLGPYTIAHQRLETALARIGAPSTGRLPIYLADTLAAPETGTLLESRFGPAGEEIKRERAAAELVKTGTDILVILGNPPYERLLEGSRLQQFATKLLDRLKEATPTERRRDLKSTKDLYVLFWVWSLWALQRPATRRKTAAIPTIDTRECSGVIGFISNRTWIVGPSLTGLRRLMQSGAKDIWICDLGGDRRGAHGAKSFSGGDGNVFRIGTGVAIAWALFDPSSNRKLPKIHYRRLYGSGPDKLKTLAAGFDPNDFETFTAAMGDAFIPLLWASPRLAAGTRLSDLFADEAETGFQTARDKTAASPLGTAKEEIYVRVPGGPRGSMIGYGRLFEWSRLKTDGARQRAWVTSQAARAGVPTPGKNSLDPAKVRRVTYRPLDMRWLYDDPAWVDWWRPQLHAIYDAVPDCPSLVTIPRDHGRGPVVIHVSALPDQHVFNNRGAKGVYSLWHPILAGASTDKRAAQGDRRAGWSTVVLDWLDSIDRAGHFEEAYNYVLAVLSAPKYTEQNWRVLEVDQPRVPMTSEASMFDHVAEVGADVRAAWDLKAPPVSGLRWAGATSLTPLLAASHSDTTISFANGRRLVGVTEEMWRWEVSGYRLLPSWFAARSHWLLTTNQAKEALAVCASVARFVQLAPVLNDFYDKMAPAVSVAAP